MPLVVVALLAALWAGLLRLGWRLPPLQPNWPGARTVDGRRFSRHTDRPGAGRCAAQNVVSGGTGTDRRWCALADRRLGDGGRGIDGVGKWGAGAGFGRYGGNIRPAYGTMASGAVALLVGTLLWALGRPIFEASTWWAGFLILVIAGERLELSRCCA